MPKPTVSVALVGKYVELHDAYMSVREALKHAALHLGVELDIHWVHSAELEKGKGWDQVRSANGMLVPGGFGSRGIEGKIQATQYARTEKVPYLGLCLGMQLMVVEFGRYRAWIGRCQLDRIRPYHALPGDRPDARPALHHRYGRDDAPGAVSVHLQPGTASSACYGVEMVEERHRHRFEFNNAYRQSFQEHGMRISGLSPDGRLVEITEIADHPFMVGTQFHPEFLSRPNRPHPLFVGFVRAAAERAGVVGSGEI